MALTMDTLDKVVKSQIQHEDFEKIIRSWTTREKALESLKDLPSHINAITKIMLQITYQIVEWPAVN